MLGAIRGTDGAVCLAVCAVFGDGVIVIALFLRIDCAIAADVGDAGLFGAIRSTDLF